nr:hypothetical protein [uncultured Cohaesibacter sp.]
MRFGEAFCTQRIAFGLTEFELLTASLKLDVNCECPIDRDISEEKDRIRFQAFASFDPARTVFVFATPIVRPKGLDGRLPNLALLFVQRERS